MTACCGASADGAYRRRHRARPRPLSTRVNAMTAPLHWREYLMEVAGLGLFMVSAATMTSLLEHPASPARALLPNPTMRRAAMGMAMGLTAAALIYSPWGRRSGAHMNPAVTLTFFRLGKISAPRCPRLHRGAVRRRRSGHCARQPSLLRPWIGHPSVNYVATMPGPHGIAVAFAAEAAISFVMMLVVLTASSHVTSGARSLDCSPRCSSPASSRSRRRCRA